MPNSTGWAHRAWQYVQQLQNRKGFTVELSRMDPPLSRPEVDALAIRLGRALPESLRRFLQAESSGLDCRYVYEPGGVGLEKLQAVLPGQFSIDGGPRLCVAHKFAKHLRWCGEWARETWVATEPEQQERWLNALPFAAIDNGDYLALDLRDRSDDPPVLYLSHDEQSVTIAGGLAQFLEAWEQLCYIGPEIWLLGEFLGEAGRLEANSEKARRLRDVLGTPRA